MSKKILIVDNHPVVVSGVITALKELDIAVECLKPIKDVSKIRNCIDLYNPDLLIMELFLPNSKGVETIKEIKKHNKFIKILVFSSQYNNLLAVKSIKAGVSGFLCKSMSLDVIKVAVKRILKGGIYISDRLNEELNDKDSNLCKA